MPRIPSIIPRDDNVSSPKPDVAGEMSTLSLTTFESLDVRHEAFVVYREHY